MRDEREMLELIVGVARKDDRIRAVYMNGSRTNRKIGKDIFQDYDIVYVVRENRPFYEDTGWIDVFGERLYMQRPDEVDRCNGLDVDFEYVYAEDAGAYAAFLGRLTERLNPLGYPVIAALAPKIAADQPGTLYEGHDFAAIGAAVNQVLLMTYEWGYTYSQISYM
mgnify:CR=1 FL=1